MSGSDGSSSLGSERFLSQFLSFDVSSQFRLDLVGLLLACNFDFLSLKVDLKFSFFLLESSLGSCELSLDL